MITGVNAPQVIGMRQSADDKRPTERRTFCCLQLSCSIVSARSSRISVAAERICLSLRQARINRRPATRKPNNQIKTSTLAGDGIRNGVVPETGTSTLVCWCILVILSGSASPGAVTNTIGESNCCDNAYEFPSGGRLSTAVSGSENGTRAIFRRGIWSSRWAIARNQTARTTKQNVDEQHP